MSRIPLILCSITAWGFPLALYGFLIWYRFGAPTLSGLDRL